MPTVAVAVWVPEVAVAVMIAVPDATPVIVPVAAPTEAIAAFDEAQVTVAAGAPAERVTAEFACNTPPTAIAPLDGVTTNEMMFDGSATTVNEPAPVFVGSAVEVATIVAWPGASAEIKPVVGLTVATVLLVDVQPDRAGLARIGHN